MGRWKGLRSGSWVWRKVDWVEKSGRRMRLQAYDTIGEGFCTSLTSYLQALRVVVILLGADCARNASGRTT